MKKYCTLFFLFLSFGVSFAQFQSGKIIYRVDPPQNLQNYVDTTGYDDIGKRIIRQHYSAIKKTAPFLRYTLTFNRNEALFKRKRQMANDNGLDPNKIASWLSTKGIYYTNIQENLKLLQFSLTKKTWLVQSKLNGLTWHLGKGTKRIQGYLCKKATAPYNLNGVKKITLIAWYCPDLPFQFGPLEASGLPGLVLGLERNNYYYYASQIKLSPDKKKIKSPQKGDIVNQKTYWKQKSNYFHRLRGKTKK